MDRKQRNYDEICPITVLWTTSFSHFPTEIVFVYEVCSWALCHNYSTKYRHVIYQMKAFFTSFPMVYVSKSYKQT